MHMEKIEQAIADHAATLPAYEAIRNALEAWKGKQINKRLVTKLQEIAPEYTAVLNRDYTPYLRVWGKGMRYDNAATVYLDNPSDVVTEDHVTRAAGIIEAQRATISRLQRELKAFPRMRDDLAKIEERITAFVEKYGTPSGYDGAKEISYTTRQALNEERGRVKF